MNPSFVGLATHRKLQTTYKLYYQSFNNHYRVEDYYAKNQRKITIESVSPVSRQHFKEGRGRLICYEASIIRIVPCGASKWLGCCWPLCEKLNFSGSNEKSTASTNKSKSKDPTKCPKVSSPFELRLSIAIHATTPPCEAAAIQSMCSPRAENLGVLVRD